MRPRTITAATLFAWSMCRLAHGAESLDEYITALGDELRMHQQAASNHASAFDKPPSLAPRRLLQQAQAIIHTASPAQQQRLTDMLIAFVPYYVIPANVSPIPAPNEYLAFTELQVIYSEILDRGAQLQRAGWAEGDKELLDISAQRLCSAPSVIDFHRRVLDGEIAAGRYPAEAVPQARALSKRLVERTAWYTSAENLSVCRDLIRTRVAP